MPYIEVPSRYRVPTKGESRIETFGFVGHACRLATRLFEKALGAKQADNLKPEFYENKSTNIQQQENE